MLGENLADYESFIYSLQDNFPSIQTSTLTVIRRAANDAVIRGSLTFPNKLHMEVREVVRFDLAPPQILLYGYEVWRGDEKLYWYDSQPHPNDRNLAATNPHHKHVPPDIKHHRVPASQLSFTEPNLPVLIREIEGLLDA